MFRTKYRLLAALLFVLSIPPLSASLRLVLQAGHDGPVTVAAWHSPYRYAVTAGNDGRIIVTRPGDGRVLHRFRVSESPVIMMSLDPNAPRAAVVTVQTKGFRLSVWDWEKEAEVYGVDLDEKPLFLSWSAKGRYLSYGRVAAPSLVLLEGRTGRSLSYLERLPSLYNYSYIGSTESTLMTYSSSGALRYWDIRTSALKGSADTLPDLKDTEVIRTGKKRYMVARSGDSVVLLDRLTGTRLQELNFPGIVEISVDAEKGEIDVLSGDPEELTLYTWKISGERFVRVGTSSRFSFPGDGTATRSVSLENITGGVSSILRAGGFSLIADISGRLFFLGSNDNVPRLLMEEKSLIPESLAFSGEALHFTAGDRIIRFRSPFFGATSRGEIDDLVGLQRDEISLGVSGSATAIVDDGGNRLIHWNPGTGSGFRIIRFGTFPRTVETDHPASFAALDAIPGDRILVLDQNGGIVIFDTDTGGTLFSYSALGMQSSAYVDRGDYVLAGRSATGSRGTPLERIDVTTRETLPIADDRFLVFNVTSGSRFVYTLGLLKESDGSTRTVLRSHDAGDPARSRTVFSVEGEDLDSVILPHPSGSSVFTTLGNGAPIRLTGNRRTTFPTNEPIRKLWIRGSILYGLDYDGAILLWEADTGKPLLRVHFFDDGGWIALPPEGNRFWASPGAVDHVILYRDGRQVDPRRLGSIIDTSP